MARAGTRQGTFFRGAALWWESDRNRVRLIRSLAYFLFAASISGTIYSGIQNVLPTWAITLYVAFAVQFVFMTFMYAIKHSGVEEIRRAVYDLRHENIEQWDFERRMLAEFARYAFCTVHDVDPAPTPPSTTRSSRRARKLPWPSIQSSDVICSYTREALDTKLAAIREASASHSTVDESHLVLTIDFIAYSAETLINLSRDICAELEDALSESDTRFTGTVKVRILIRDTDDINGWLVPLANDPEKDREYDSSLRTRFQNVQKSALREFQENLRDIIAPKQVEFRVRGYHTEPLLKGILIDGTKGLFGLYTISELRDPDGWDYSGHSVVMCPCNTQGNYVESTSANLLSQHFGWLWENRGLTRPLDG